jgi:hypothetical protein
VTIPSQSPIGLSQFTPFLCHVGSRVGFFSDPPGPSVVVEAGIFEEIEYAGVVLTPTTPTAGAVRIDLVIANPIAEGGQAIELVTGVEGEAAPSISDSPGAAKIAEVRVTGNSAGLAVISTTDILDLRPILEIPRPAYKLLFIGRVRLGDKMQTTIGSTKLLGEDFNYPFEQILTVKRVGKNKRVGSLPGHRFDRLDLEMPYYVEDFHLVGGPWDTLVGAQVNQDRSNMAVGVTWKNRTSETQDSEGRDLPLVRIASAGASGKSSGDGPTYFGGDQGQLRKHAFFQFQAWGRI